MVAPKWEELTQTEKDGFSMQMNISVLDSWVDNCWDNDEFRAIVKGQFTPKFWEDCKVRAKNRQVHYYHTTDPLLYKALDEHPIKDMNIIIFGAAAPFYEAVALEYDAKSVTVSEYEDRTVLDPRISYVRPQSIEREFDVALSISSFEHSGLGRYGDPIDTEGDIAAMVEAHILLKPGGLLYLAIPVGKDVTFFNERRHYGRKRLPMMLEGWKTIDTYGYQESDMDMQHMGGHQPVFVLEPIHD